MLVGDCARHTVWSIDGRVSDTVSRSLVSRIHHRCGSQLCRCSHLPEPQRFKPSLV